MLKLPIYQVDAFTRQLFSGDPGAACILDDATLQAIAAENNLSETACPVENGSGFDLRWFPPLTEVAPCGHATPANAFVQV